MRTPVDLLRRVASLNRYLASLRVLGFLPANAIVIALLVMIAVIALREGLDSYLCDAQPRPVRLDQLVANEPTNNRYVEVTGMAYPEASLTHRSSRRGLAGPVQYVHVAILGEGGETALLVKFPGDIGHGEPRRVTVSGMLAPPDARLRAALQARDWTLAGRPVERRFVLLAGITPRPVWVYATITAVAGGTALMFLLMPLRKWDALPAQQTQEEIQQGDHDV